MPGWWGLRRGLEGRLVPAGGHGLIEFHFGKLWGTPPVFLLRVGKVFGFRGLRKARF
jgi:hypothetical protein